METGELIKKLRLEHKMTQEQLGEILGVQKSVIAKYEKGRVKNLKRSTIQKLAETFHVSPLEFLDIDFDIPNAKNIPIFELDKVKMPLLGAIACGEPIYAEEDRESYVMAGTDVRADFCLKAQGDSMIGARIHDGDIIFVKKQEMVNDGEIAVVLVGEEATLKRFYYYKEQNMVILRAENPKYKDLVYTNEDINQIRVLGKAVAFQSDIK